MPPPKLQFAFQGGGAKFISMLPVAHAISDLEKDKRIVLTTLAGTSAGSICAALIAASCDFNRLITYLRASGDRHIQTLCGSMPDIAHLQGMVSNIRTDIEDIKLYNPASWKKLNRWRGEISALMPFLKAVGFEGRAVLRSEELENFIQTIFSFCKRDVSKGEHRLIESYQNPRLLITATDLAASDGITAKGNLLRAIVDSCSIPIALRSFGYLGQSTLVDGGLCNNLPANYLVSDPAVPAFLVYPLEKEKIARPHIDNFFSYFLSVMSCPIDYNVKRSKELIDESFHIKVDVDYSTFDFRSAMTFLNDKDACDAVYESTISQLNDFLNTYGNMTNRSQVRVTDTRTIAEYVSAIETLTASFEEHINVKRCTLIVHVNEKGRGPKDSDSRESRAADTVTMKTDFEVIDRSFRYYRSNLRKTNDNKTVPSIWYANNLTRKSPVPIRVLSLGPHSVAGFQQCLVEFLEPERHFAVTDVLELFNVSYRKNDMNEMNEGRPEFIGITNPHSAPFETAELICRYPRALGSFRMVVDDHKSHIKSSSVKDIDGASSSYDHEFETIGLQGADLAPMEKFFARIVPMGSQ